MVKASGHYAELIIGMAARSMLRNSNGGGWGLECVGESQGFPGADTGPVEYEEEVFVQEKHTDGGVGLARELVAIARFLSHYPDFEHRVIETALFKLEVNRRFKYARLTPYYPD